MRILVILGHNRLTGVNTWAYTLAKELIGLGSNCDIEISSSEYGKFFFDNNSFHLIQLMHDGNIKYYINKFVNYSQYDGIILSYNCHAKKLEGYTGKKIFVVHGISSNFDGLYDPSLLDNSYTKVAISQYLAERYFCDTCINHGIDLQFFRPQPHASSAVPKKAFILSRYFNNIDFAQTMTDLNIECISPATHGVMTLEQVRENIWQSDFVVATGRSAYEAMACNKPVYLLGAAGADGWVKPKTFDTFLYKNCSGYTNVIQGPKEYFIRDIQERYSIHDGFTNQCLSQKLSSDKMTRRFLQCLEL